ncbi:hypothetical protein KUV95_14780 [Microbulbifer agarilyticus]|uniref:RHS repeat-associated core domain-containing protein n=1 Tax=Microbulbifer agarilyticus TaxID=260552 RepID=UPI001C94BD7F|nr:RHS repeat-associated core domain-containing protein [Microbulbifer agarilyticus]MBY6212820.1 hypothetical protein [Microbulbifer agarilyticus]
MLVQRVLLVVFAFTSAIAFAGVSGPSSDNDGMYTISYSWDKPFSSLKPESIKIYKNGALNRTITSGYGASSYGAKETSTGSWKYEVFAEVEICLVPGPNGACYEPDSRVQSIGFWTVNVTAILGTPGAISGPTNDADGSFTLSWAAASGVVARYELYKQTVGTSTWELVHSGTARSKAISGWGSGQYDFRVRACSSTSCGSYTANKRVTVARTPGVPASISTPSNNTSGTYTVSWGAATGTVTSYQFYEQKNGGSWVSKYTGTSRSKSFSGNGDGSYRYRVRACNKVGTYTSCSAYKTSGTFYVARPPSTPSSISGVPTTDNNGAFTVSWGASTGTVTKYQLYQQKDGGSWSSIYSGTGRSKAVSGLGDGDYAFRVRACNTVGSYTTCSGYKTSGTATVANVPGTPASISGVPGTDADGAFTVSWGASSGTVDKYQLYQQKNSGSWTKIYEGTGLSKAVSGLTDGTYAFRVRAYNTENSYTAYSGYRTSGNAIVSRTPGVPASISGVPATDGNGAFTVSWGASSGTVDSYELYQQKDSGSWSKIYTGTGTSKAVSGLADGTYAFRVRAYNTESTYTTYSGYRTSGSVIVANAPGTPASLSGIPATDDDGGYTVSWGVSSGTVDGYQLQQQLNGGSWATIYSGTGQSKAVSGLEDGTYKFRVRAFNTHSTYTAYGSFRTSGESIVGIKPGYPATISGVPGTDNNGAFTISWSASGGIVDGYELQQQKNGGNWSNIYTGTGLSKAVSGLGDGTYSFRVRAYNTEDSFTSYSAYNTSSSATVANVPGVPSSISGVPTTDVDGSFTVSWATATGTVDGYKLEQQTNGGSWAQIYSGTGTSKAVSALADGTYAFRVRAFNTEGSYTAHTGYRTSGNAIVARQPATPASISGVPTNNSSGAFTVSWAAVTANTDQYQLQQQTNGGSWSTIYTGSGTSKAVSGLADGAYAFRVRAQNLVSSHIQSGSFRTSGTATVANKPATPSSISGVPATNTSGGFTISWTAVAAPADKYRLQQQKDGGSWVEIYNGTGLSKAVSGLADGAYKFRVQALNTQGSYTAYGDFRTSTQAAVASVPGLPGAISGVPATDADGAMTLSWGTASGNVDTYELYQSQDGGSWELVSNAAANSRFVSGLSGGSWAFRVRACNTVASFSACGGYSTSGSAVVHDAPEAPQAPVLATAPTAGSSEVINSDKIGALAGEFRVNEAGSATYNVPIAVAPGIAGVAPQLSIGYSSSSGNGLLGKGWSLGGLSAISRCRQTLAVDGKVKPISWTAEDRFCLDGQRLLLQSGVYGANGSTYKTEIDSFATVTASGGTTGNPASFTVTRKDGSTSTYGGTTASKLNGGSATLTWAQSRFEDSAGNGIDFVYTGDANSGHRISSISYAGGAAEVAFEYETRPDRQSGYTAGHHFLTTQRLSRVTTKNGTTELREYVVNYVPTSTLANADKASRIESIEECVGSTCLPATNFSWSTPSVTYPSSGVSGLDFSPSSDRFYVSHSYADINGDGKQDLVWHEGDHDDGYTDSRIKYALGNGSTYSLQHYLNGPSNPSYFSNAGVGSGFGFRVLDYNADGRHDIAIYDNKSSYGKVANRWYIYLSRYTGTNNNWKLDFNGINTGLTGEDAIFADFNGDGLADFIKAEVRDGKQTLVVRELVPSGNAPTSDTYYKFASEKTYPINTDGATLGSDEDRLAPALGDFNGDGVVDILVTWYEWEQVGCRDQPGEDPVFRWRDEEEELIELYAARYIECFDPIVAQLQKGHAIATFDGDSFEEYAYVSGSKASDKPLTAVDVNGDGLTDVAYHNGSSFYVRLSTGTGLSSSLNLTSSDKASFADLNRDGYLDVFWPDYTAQKLKVRYWQPGNNTFSAETDFRSLPSTSDKYMYWFADVNGDTQADYHYLQKNGELYTHLANRNDSANRNKPDDVIVQIDNGMGNITDITYANAVDKQVYSRLEMSSETETVCITLPPEPGTPMLEEEICYPVTTGDPATLYDALNGPWDLPEGAQTLGKEEPVLDVLAPMFLVSRVESTSPAARATAGSVDATATSAVSYKYHQMKLQAAGRGMLGFQKVSSTDEQTGVITETSYRQDFPFMGMPLLTETRTASGKVLSRASNEWRLQGWNGSGTPAKPYRPFIAKSVEETYALKNNGTTQGGLLQSVLTETTQDSYGNATRVTMTTSDADGNDYVKDTVNTFPSSGWAAEMGRMSKTVVTSTRGAQSVSRTSSFTYYPQNDGARQGLLKEEIVEPGTSFEVKTTYDYDSFGNKKTVTASAAGEAARSSSYVYDSAGRYLKYSTNALGQKTSEVLARDAFGNPTQVRDVNGVVSYAYHSKFGRKYFEASPTGAWSQTLMKACDGSCPASAQYFAESTGAGGAKSRSYVDTLGREIRKAAIGFDGRWVYTDVEYDQLGRVARQSTPYFQGTSRYWTEFEYDLLGRVTRSTLPGVTNPITASYDGFTTVTTNPKGQTKTEKKNAFGELVEVTDHLGGRITYGYDPQGNLKTLNSHGSPSDPHNIVTTLTYDIVGRKIAMDDPDKGQWSYQYTGFGELKQQTDAKGQTSSMTYDKLGRMVNRIDRRAGGSIEGNTTWTYDVASNGLGQLESVQDSVSGYIRIHGYDSFGRPSNTLTSLGLGGALGGFETTAVYDQYGRVFQEYNTEIDAAYDAGATQNLYNQYGFLHKVVNAYRSGGNYLDTYYTVAEMDARGNVTEFVQGNGITTSKVYDPLTGRLTTQTAGTVAGLGEVQELHYDWDDVDNLLFRKDLSGSSNLHEDFTYDGLNRLLSSKVVGKAAQVMTYDSLGNIKSKSDVGSGDYVYGNDSGSGPGPHAVIATPNGVTYSYDANGNMTSDSSGRSIDYSTFDKPLAISKGGHTTSFAYSPERKRYWREDVNSSGTTTTLYLGNVEQVTTGNIVKVKRYIQGTAIETDTYNVGSSWSLQESQLRYLHNDHLGSLHRITDENGSVVEELSFDSWGKRRDPINWAAVSVSDLMSSDWSGLTAFTTTRGYTGHEMLDEVGLIHMNGRIYDAHLGRFMQADPYVQAATDTQALNRYSYLKNNPLNATDPSGYFLKKLWNKIKPFISVIVGAALVYFTGGATSWFLSNWVGGATLGAITGAAGAAANGGNILKGAFLGALTGAFGAMASGLEGLAAFAAHGMIGGVASVIQGGKFGHGFASAGFGNYLGGKIKLVNSDTGKLVASAAVGGTISKATGGKFANGAGGAAFAFAMNSLAASGGSSTRKVGPLAADHVDSVTAVGLRDEGMEEWAKLLPDDGEGTYSVVAHGYSAAMANKSAAEWAEILAPKLTDATENIRLYSCNTGSGQNSFAEQLSIELSNRGFDVSVEAPQNFIQAEIATQKTPKFGIGGLVKGYSYKYTAQYHFSNDYDGLDTTAPTWRKFKQ